MTTKLLNLIAVLLILGLAFLAASCSDKPEPGTHVHADGTVHADQDPEDQKKPEEKTPAGTHVHDDGTVHADHEPTEEIHIDEQGRPYHLHADGSIHYLDASESRVSGSTINIPAEDIAKFDIGVATAGPGQLDLG